MRVIGKKVIMTTGLLEGIGVVKRALLVFSTTKGKPSTGLGKVEPANQLSKHGGKWSWKMLET